MLTSNNIEARGTHKTKHNIKIIADLVRYRTKVGYVGYV